METGKPLTSFLDFLLWNFILKLDVLKLQNIIPFNAKDSLPPETDEFLCCLFLLFPELGHSGCKRARGTTQNIIWQVKKGCVGSGTSAAAAKCPLAWTHCEAWALSVFDTMPGSGLTLWHICISTVAVSTQDKRESGGFMAWACSPTREDLAGRKAQGFPQQVPLGTGNDKTCLYQIIFIPTLANDKPLLLIKYKLLVTTFLAPPLAHITMVSIFLLKKKKADFTDACCWYMNIRLRINSNATHKSFIDPHMFFSLSYVLAFLLLGVSNNLSVPGHSGSHFQQYRAWKCKNHFSRQKIATRTLVHNLSHETRSSTAFFNLSWL